ncbi:hypothetical protein TIFTF001_010365 [Ficus carica]|uniref:Uncharacterized protein n=1 Tax=Ficus carica TaxID=3494 RepID=A0AA88A8J0_FICCA|nr:hypothetical protein TIFTF001_043709 [Ficus carica]GMN41128.1 hypothetical protein TIFTF001_010365 [Ficus carica]
MSFGRPPPALSSEQVRTRTVLCSEHLDPGSKASLASAPVSYGDHPPTLAAHHITNNYHLP